MVMRNERPYLYNCLGHLIRNGVDFFIIDNQSEDQTLSFLRSREIAPHVVGVESFPFDGTFDWAGLVEAREAASRRIDADWILFVSADEMMHSYREGERLCDAIARIARDGCDVIDFNEFVFLPVDSDYADAEGFPALTRYYFFEPYRPRLMRARRADLALSHLDAGGHTFAGEYNLAQETLALRHYIVRTQEHAYRKYADRVHREEEVAKGWHRNRIGHAPKRFTFPPAAQLLTLPDPHVRALDRRAPRTRHYWEWDKAAAA
jgi:hypothetical protein